MCSSYSFAQVNTKIVASADQKYNEFDYWAAIKLYESAYELGDSNLHVVSRLANSYRFVKQSIEAELWYRRLSKIEGRTSEDLFNYILVLKNNNRYNLAEDIYDLAAKEVPNDYRLNQFQNNKNYVNEIFDAPKLYSIEKVLFNSPSEDFSPTYYEDQLVFLSSLKYGPTKKSQLNFYHISLVAEDVKVKKFGKKLGTSFHEGPMSFSAEEDEVYFTRTSSGGKGLARASVERAEFMIFRADKSKKKWTKPESVSFNVSGYSVGHPSITADGKILFFISNMPGGYGGMDLYKVVRSNIDSEWSKPINLGKKINTEGDELYPFVHANGNLYFASNGHLGLGGLDVFTSNYSNENNDVFHLGYGVNTDQDDFGFILNEDKTSGYFSSNREGGMGTDDIYKFEIAEGAIDDQLTRNTLSDIGFIEKEIEESKGDENSQGMTAKKVMSTIKSANYASSSIDIQLENLKLITDSLFSLKFDYKKIGTKENPLVELDLTQISLIEDSIHEKRIYYEKFSYDEDSMLQIKILYKDYEEQLLNLDLGNLSFLSHSMIVPMRKAREQIVVQKEKDNSFIFLGTIFEENTQIRLPNVRVIIKDKNDKSKQFVEVTGPYGTFKDTVRGYELYSSLAFEIYLKKEGYISKSFAFEEILTEYGEIDLEEYLKKIRLTKAEVNVEIGKAANLNPIYFDLDKSNIRPDASVELDKVVEVLKEEPNLFIELGSHTDSRANDAYNLTLSNRRSKSATDYIISKGIDPERLTSFGYGESKLVNRCGNDVSCTDEEHEMNRRTEFKIVKIAKSAIEKSPTSTANEIKKETAKQQSTIGVFGKAIDNKTLDVLGAANVVIKNNKTGATLYQGRTDVRGVFKGKLKKIQLNKALYLDIELSKAGYISRSFTFNTVVKEFGDIDLNKFLKDFHLVKVENVVELGKAANINPIYFDPDKVEIRKDAAVELDKIAAILLKEYKLAVEVSSHTDSRAEDSYNLKLSKMRAEAIETYLVKKGISYGRIFAKGYGETKLVNLCSNGVKCSEDEHKENRRTEFKIVNR